jgi:hypothetical protein
LTGGSDDNYDVLLVDGILSVGRAPLTATAEDVTRPYGGSNAAFAIRYSGFVNGDTPATLDSVPTATTTATSLSGPGNYAIVLTGGNDEFYDLVLVDGNLTVTKATLLVRADDQSRPFSATNPPLTLSYAGFVNGETADMLASQPTATTTATNGSPLGVYPILVAGGTDDHYALTLVNGSLVIHADDEFGFALSSAAGIYKRRNPPVRVDAIATLLTGGRTDFGNGGLSLTIVSNASVGDVLGVQDESTAAGGIGLAGDVVRYGAVDFARIVGDGSSAGRLDLSFNSNATSEAVQALGRHLTFAASNNQTRARVVAWVLTDSASNASAPAFKTVAIDNPPALPPVEMAALNGKRVYNGLVWNSADVVPTQSGYFRLNVRSNGAYSGYVMQGKKRVGLSGHFNSSGQASALGAAGVCGVDLELVAGTDAVRGLVTPYRPTGASTELFGRAAGLSDPRLAGAYTLVLPGSRDAAAEPGGYGYATVKIDAQGNVKFSASLANGRKVTRSSLVAMNGEWPWHAPSASGRSALLGWLKLWDGPGSDIAGPLTWIEEASAKAKYYAGGFAGELTAAGSKYIAPRAADPALNWSAGEFVAWGGNLPAALTNHVTLSSPGALADEGGGLERLKFKLNAKTGVFHGTFQHPETRPPAHYYGVLLQKSAQAAGYFLGLDQSGAVVLEATLP